MIQLFSRFAFRALGIALVCLWCLDSGAQAQTQVVFLSFTGTDGQIDYTQSMRDAIQAEMETNYDAFDISFTQSQPPQPFSQLTFNSGFPGGVADQIDFRNLDRSDNAVINVDDPDNLFGLELGPNSPPQVLIDASTLIGSHELGHILGLRHGDSFGPLGSGLGSPGPGSGAYLPSFPGPSGANLSLIHI